MNRAAWIAILLAAMPAPSHADVHRTWDWHRVPDEKGVDKTVIHYCVQTVDAKDGLPDGQTWKQHLDAATRRWNTLKPWRFEPSKPPDECQLELRIRDHNVGGGAYVSSRDACDRIGIQPGRARKLFLCVDPTPLTQGDKPTTWGLPDGFSPTWVLAHELGHALRLDHPHSAGHSFDYQYDENMKLRRIVDENGKEYTEKEVDQLMRDDVMEQFDPGQGERAFSDHDKEEARDSADRGKTSLQERRDTVTPQPRNYSMPWPVYYSRATSAPPEITMSVAARFARAPSQFLWRALYGPTVPVRDAVPAGHCPVFLAVEVDFAAVKSGGAAAELKLPYLDRMLFENQSGLRSRVIREEQLTVVRMQDGERWQPYQPGARVDRASNVVAVLLRAGERYVLGLSGPCQPAQPLRRPQRQ